MNSTVYIFGNLSSGYTQYPDEGFSSEIFHKLYQRSKATTQIAIHRDGHLMYYSYIRKLEQSQYIGLCMLLNDAMITSFGNLFSLFENTIGILAEKGHLIRYNENGNLVANAEKLFNKPEEIGLVTETLKRGFDNLANTAQRLPPENFSVGKDSTKEFTVEDASADILKSSHTNGYTFIYKSKGFNTALMNSYKGVLSRITKENNNIKAENLKLKAENEKILRQKKQFKNVILLTFVVIGCGVGLYFLYDNLNNTQGQLDEANKDIAFQKEQIAEARDSIHMQISIIDAKNATIAKKDAEIRRLNDTVYNHKNKLLNEENARRRAEDNYSDLKDAITANQPLIIKSANFSFSTGIITINYFGLSYSSYSFSYRIIGPDGYIETRSGSFTVYSGHNSQTVKLTTELNSSKTYYIEILYNNKVIGGGKF